MRHYPVPVLGFIALCLLAGCNRTDDPDRTTPAVPAPVDTTPAPTDNDASDAITMRYRCGEHAIDVMGNQRARVTMPDGRAVELAYVADSSPPLFSGETLEFSVDAGGAQLAQAANASWPCSAE